MKPELGEGAGVEAEGSKWNVDCVGSHEHWLFLDDIAAKTGFMVTEKGERAFQGPFYAARFLLNEQDF